jgi:hypothetical protein
MNKSLFIFFLITSTFFDVSGQEKISKQNNSFKLPINYKIDGLAAEWNNTFANDNKSVGIKYTIANDEEKLYLILKAEDIQVINKIVSQGICFNIKNGNKNVSVFYPVYEDGKRPLFLSIKQRKNGDDEQEKLINDSLKKSFNSKLIESLQKIGVKGVPEIRDSLISIYNQDGIRANGKFDHQINYTLEIVIPLNLLNDTKKFDYMIQLNGVPGKVEILEAAGGNRIVYIRNGVMYGIGMATPENYALAYPSNLSGTYILAK